MSIKLRLLKPNSVYTARAVSEEEAELLAVLRLLN